MVRMTGVMPALVLLWLCLPLHAQVEEIEAQVGAVTCGTCFNVAVATLKEVSGVNSVEGDLKSGRIRITVNPKKGTPIWEVQNRVQMAGLKDNVRYMITASGKLEQRGGRMVLVVPNQEETLEVDAGDREKMAMNAAAARETMRATGEIVGKGTRFDLKIQKLQKQ